MFTLQFSKGWMNLNIRKIKKIKAFSIIYIWSQSLIMFKKCRVLITLCIFLSENTLKWLMLLICSYFSWVRSPFCSSSLLRAPLTPIHLLFLDNVTCFCIRAFEFAAPSGIFSYLIQNVLKCYPNPETSLTIFIKHSLIPLHTNT